MSDIKRLVYSFIQFLGQQLNDSSLSADAIESLEVAIQCLETAYGINHTNPDTVASLQVSQPLLTIFTNATKNEKTSGQDGQSGHSHAGQSFTSTKSSQSVVTHQQSGQSLHQIFGKQRSGQNVGKSRQNMTYSWPVRDCDPEKGDAGRVIEASSSETDDEDDDEDEDAEDFDEKFLNNNNVSDRNGNNKDVKWPCQAVIYDDSSPLDLSVVGGKSMSVSDSESEARAIGGAVRRGSPVVGHGHSHHQSHQQLSGSHQLGGEHNLVRMPPKGGCVQCGKEGRVTKRGRPHESYFGCRRCQPKVTPAVVSEEQKREAEKLKNEGNNLMKTEKYPEALLLYTRAIEIDSKNAIYYCNRAAAHSKMNNHKQAIDDCRIAIHLDPNYSKAYGRMGLAFDSLNQPREAKECYEKAVQLEPQNDGYAQNLRVAEEKLRETNIGPGGPGGPFDLGALLNNPTLMNMATQMMSDPNIQQVMGNLLTGSAAPQVGGSSSGGGGGGGVVGGGGGGGGGSVGNSSGSGGPGGSNGFEALLQAGQQLAAQMQATNPNLVEMLRQQMQGGGGGSGGGQNRPNSGDSQQNN